MARFYEPVPTKIDDSEMELFNEARGTPIPQNITVRFTSDPVAHQQFDTAPMQATGKAAASTDYTGAGIEAGGSALAKFGQMWSDSQQKMANRIMDAEMERGAMNLQSSQRTSMAGHNALTGLINAYRAALRKG